MCERCVYVCVLCASVAAARRPPRPCALFAALIFSRRVAVIARRTAPCRIGQSIHCAACVCTIVVAAVNLALRRSLLTLLCTQVLVMYFKKLEEESVRDNFVVIYELVSRLCRR